ncbi:(2Fe-2S)-binding protein [Rhodococcus sp. WB1]|uniref:QcrA and Rieske domain-containing protein n=1 Tax=Rhodococcus TaxID=1827 RepID=UPI0002D214C1|nr:MULTISPECIES: Rieske (2Fe-2S) protein [Rhodococcus]ANZ24273.1 (2Fe-2S)-binding protein [Rhodococcus sp. WB1]MDV6293827.1 Rieske (2Fe-2S) protein [Rhodococcus aetherivorans]CCW09848.1 iron sulphur protein [Rhodococcus aetherivorans]
MDFEQSPVSRRSVLLGAGVAAVAATAACSTYGDEPASGQTSAAEDAGTGAAAGQPLAAVADIPVGGGRIFPDQKVVVTQPAAGEVLAFSAICTHQGCTVAAVQDGTINCPCHGSRFNLDGTVANGPAARPLESRAVTVENGEITLA